MSIISVDLPLEIRELINCSNKLGHLCATKLFYLLSQKRLYANRIIEADTKSPDAQKFMISFVMRSSISRQRILTPKRQHLRRMKSLRDIRFDHWHALEHARMKVYTAHTHRYFRIHISFQLINWTGEAALSKRYAKQQKMDVEKKKIRFVKNAKTLFSNFSNFSNFELLCGMLCMSDMKIDLGKIRCLHVEHKQHRTNENLKKTIH